MRAHQTDFVQQLEQALSILLFFMLCVVVLGPRSGLLHAVSQQPLQNLQ